MDNNPPTITTPALDVSGVIRFIRACERFGYDYHVRYSVASETWIAHQSVVDPDYSSVARIIPLAAGLESRGTNDGQMREHNVPWGALYDAQSLNVDMLLVRQGNERTLYLYMEATDA